MDAFFLPKIFSTKLLSYFSKNDMITKWEIKVKKEDTI